MNISKNKIFFLLIVIIGCTLSILLSFYYIGLYDNYHMNGRTHIMLKEETFYHWWEAAKIIEQIKEGVSIFVAGSETITKPLPQRLVALYSILFNFDIVDNWDNFRVNLGNKFLFLSIQSLFYYVALFYFLLKVTKFFPTKITIGIALFLSLEPTIFQYHSSFWTESLYFSLQLIIFALMIDEKNNPQKFIILGLLLGILFLQRSAGMFYIFVVVIYYLLFLKKNKITNIFLIITTYSIICFGLGMHNYKKSGVFYVMPLEGKYGMYRYFSLGILGQVNNMSEELVIKSEKKKSYEWMVRNFSPQEKNNLIDIKNKYENKGTPTGMGRNIENKITKMKYYDYLNQRSYKILLDNPVKVITKVLNGFIHFSVLNPFFVYYDYEFYKNKNSVEIGDFAFSETHKKLIPYRIFYSLLIYVVSLVGFILCFKKYPKITFLIILSILYYYLILGWYGKTRLFVPILIYNSIFFGNGIIYFLDKLKKNYLK